MLKRPELPDGFQRKVFKDRGEEGERGIDIVLTGYVR